MEIICLKRASAFCFSRRPRPGNLPCLLTKNSALKRPDFLFVIYICCN